MYVCADIVKWSIIIMWSQFSNNPIYIVLWWATCMMFLQNIKSYGQSCVFILAFQWCHKKFKSNEFCLKMSRNEWPDFEKSLQVSGRYINYCKSYSCSKFKKTSLTLIGLGRGVGIRADAVPLRFLNAALEQLKQLIWNMVTFPNYVSVKFRT